VDDELVATVAKVEEAVNLSWTKYWTMAEPPSEDGADQESDTAVFVAVPVKDCGAVGAVAAAATEKFKKYKKPANEKTKTVKIKLKFFFIFLAYIFISNQKLIISPKQKIRRFGQ